MKPPLLIADGDTDACDLHQRFLSECGYQVEAAVDGLDCLTKLRQQKPAALVLDLELRWGGGDGVLDWIRQESSMRGIPVILTATAGYPQEMAEFNESPVVDFLPKPFPLTALLECVRSAVAKNGFSQPSNLKRVYPELFFG